MKKPFLFNKESGSKAGYIKWRKENGYKIVCFVDEKPNKKGVYGSTCKCEELVVDSSGKNPEEALNNAMQLINMSGKLI